MKDELYCNRMLPQNPAINNDKYEDQTVSTFYSQALQLNQDEAIKGIQLLHKGLSCFTKRQNESHGILVNNIKEQVLTL